jgi:cyclic beta-1,2-glucan synthetase
VVRFAVDGWWISLPLARREAALTVEQTRVPAPASRAGPGPFSITSSAPEDHWLPPDNFQEYRVASIAIAPRRPTSGWRCWPTCGLRFRLYPGRNWLSARTRCDDGGLERHRGHFYNWYDTQTLQPLLPRTFRRWTAAIWPAIC